jgi:hypothetical protein
MLRERQNTLLNPTIIDFILNINDCETITFFY